MTIEAQLVDVRSQLEFQRKRADDRVAAYERQSLELEREHEARQDAEAALVQLRQMVEKWTAEQATYPATSEGMRAAAAVRCCANELAALLQKDPA